LTLQEPLIPIERVDDTVLRLTISEKSPLPDSFFHEALGWVCDPAFRGDFLPFSKTSKREAAKGIRKMMVSQRPRSLGIVKASSSELIGLVLYYRPQGFDYFEVGDYLVPHERGEATALRL
jgi:hypothetical protein